MAEERVFFQSTGLKIEGLLDRSSDHEAVIVTHPHPLYGGSMHNQVVKSVVAACRDLDLSTLRFNFRGVGQSEGRYGHGRGEQDDVKAALAFISGLGKTSIDLAGYSFGAWVNARGLDDFHEARQLIMVSPPVKFLDFSFMRFNAKIQLVIAGSEDDIAPPHMIKEMLPSWNPDARFEIIPGADHFYAERTGELQKAIKNFLGVNPRPFP